MTTSFFKVSKLSAAASTVFFLFEKVTRQDMGCVPRYVLLFDKET